MVAIPGFADKPVSRPVQRGRQLLWLVILLPTVIAYAVGLAGELSAPLDLCAEMGPDCTEAAVTAAAARVGLTPRLALATSIAFSDIGVPVGCLLMAVFIVWRRPDRLITLAVAAMLALYGPLVNTTLVDGGLWALGLGALATAYHLLFQVLFYYVLFNFPTGRFVPRWAWAPFVLGLGAYLVYTAGGGEPPAWLLLVPVTALGLQVYRFQRASTPTERQQSKWVLVGLAAFLLNFLLYVFLIKPVENSGVAALPAYLVFTPINFVLVLSLPVTLLIASLRYRLWDIDVIVRRTLVYSVLTALLALIYFVTVVVLQALLQTLTGQQQNALVTVLSTLAIAALFGPLRRRVQTTIDRRFYRRAYNAAQISAAFGETLRAELELEKVSAQLVDTVDLTLQPAEAHLWLKPPPKTAR